MCGALWNRTTFSGFSVLRIHHVCQSSRSLLLQMESNHYLQIQILPHYHYAMEQYFAEAKGFEPLRRFRLSVLHKLLTLDIIQASLMLFSLNRNFQDRCNKPTLPNLHFGDEGGSRTHNRQFRRLLLCPIELPHHICGSRRIRTFGTWRFGTLAVCWFKPLTHTSFILLVQR